MTAEPLTIAAVNAYLSQDLALIAADKIDELRFDKRRGVQNALAKYERRLLKEQQISRHIHELRAQETALHQAGYQFVAGVDEVGRGPLAGPVVAGAVILPADMPPVYFNDSKQLSALQRKNLVADIERYAVAYAVDQQEAEVIDEINILQATKTAMKNSLQGLTPTPEYVLIDAVHLDGIAIPQKSIIKGDATTYCIAAASIYAKEYRDQLMIAYADIYPHYGFEKNAGYGTKQHLAAIEKYGITPIHRKTFAPIKNLI